MGMPRWQRLVAALSAATLFPLGSVLLAVEAGQGLVATILILATVAAPVCVAIAALLTSGFQTKALRRETAWVKSMAVASVVLGVVGPAILGLALLPGDLVRDGLHGLGYALSFLFPLLVFLGILGSFGRR
jgi:hypothetical protein